MLICAAAAPRPKGIGKKWQLKHNTYLYILYLVYALVLHTHVHKKKVKMVTGEGTWTKGPFVKKTFLSFVLRTAAAAATIPPSSSSPWHAAYRRRKHLQKVRGAATKCLARLFEQSSIFATVSQLHKTAELVKKNSSYT